MLTEKSGRFSSSSRSNKFPHKIRKQIENFESAVDCLFAQCGIARHEHIVEFEEIQFNLWHSGHRRCHAACLFHVQWRYHWNGA